MEVIVEVYDRSGRVFERRKLTGTRITIGRAYDNDLILSDPTVDPCHACLQVGADGEVTVADLGSLNGIYDRNMNRVAGNAEVVSGHEYHLGNTRIRIFRPEHIVARTARIDSVDYVSGFFDRTGTVLVFLVVVMVVYACRQWLNMFSGFKWQDIANVLLLVGGSAMVAATFWAVIGRVVKHHTYFRTQLSFILLFILCQFLLYFFYDLFLYNTLDSLLSSIVFLAIDFFVLAGLFWFNLNVATNQTRSQRTVTATVMAGVLLILSMYSEILSYAEFSDRPDYVKTLKIPAMLFTHGVSEDEFLADSAQVFDSLQDD